MAGLGVAESAMNLQQGMCVCVVSAMASVSSSGSRGGYLVLTVELMNAINKHHHRD
jgi:hypothetical protein